MVSRVSPSSGRPSRRTPDGGAVARRHLRADGNAAGCGQRAPTDGLAKRLRAAGYRLTEPRVAVLAVLQAGAGNHWSPAEVLESGRRHYRRLSRPTVYRTLELLTELGLIRPLLLGDGIARYTVTAGGHHHLVCSDCGSVEEFEDCRFNDLGATLAERHDFRIGGHLLEVYGTCRACA